MAKFGKRRFRRAVRRVMKHRRKKRLNDYGKILKNVKTYPFIFTGESDVFSNGITGSSQLFSLYVNFPAYWVNTGGTPAVMDTYSGNIGFFLRNQSNLTIFDEYRVEKCVARWYPLITQTDEANGPTVAFPVITASFIDTDSINVTPNPNNNVMMNYNLHYHPAVQRIMTQSYKNINKGTLERGWYNCQYINPTQLNVVTQATIIPIPKRSSIGFYWKSFNGNAATFMGRVVVKWYVRFRNTAGSLNRSTEGV